jgi:BMFP domain-containing protein YqiC
MEEEITKNQSGVDVGALVTAIIAFLLAVVPCLGLIAIIPAVIAIVLAIVGLSRSNNNQGMLVGGLVVAVIALMISVSQSFVIGKIANNSGKWSNDIEKVIRDVTDDIEKEFGDNEITIRIDNDDETVEIKASAKKDELKDRLEELEGTTDTVKNEAETETEKEEVQK